MKVVTSYHTLMQYAKELGAARKSGDCARIADAKARHDNYHAICMEADEMHVGCTWGELHRTGGRADGE